MEAERERQKQQDSPPSPEESPQELARSMSDAAMAEAVEQQNKSDEKSHLPAWLRSSGVQIMAHRLHVKSLKARGWPGVRHYSIYDPSGGHDGVDFTRPDGKRATVPWYEVGVEPDASGSPWRHTALVDAHHR